MIMIKSKIFMDNIISFFAIKETKIFKEKLLETGCYEEVVEAIFNTVEIHLNRYRYTYRITP